MIKVSGRVVYEDLQKMKLLGSESRAFINAEFDSILRVFKGWWYRRVPNKRDRDGNLRIFNCNRNGSKSWLDNNNGRDDNKWNDNNRFFFVRKSLISLSLLRESFVLVFFQANHRVPYLFHLFFPKAR